MESDQFYQIGHISRAHGNDGKVYVQLDVDDIDPYYELESVFLDLEYKPVPFFIEYIRQTSSGPLVKFEDIDSREDASRYIGAGVLLPIDQLPELPDGKFYYHELIGTTLFDKKGHEIGLIELIYDQTSQILLGVNRMGKEILVPMVDEFDPQLDKVKKSFHMEIPEGLIDINEEQS